jgi:hypothetical protein
MSALNIVVISTASGGFTCDSADIDVGNFVTISGTFEGTGTGSIDGYLNPTTYKVSAVTGDAYERTGFTLTTITDASLATFQGTPVGVTYIKTPSTPKASVKPKIKLGFDRTPAPVVEQLVQLVDIEGALLYDPSGTPLMTEDASRLDTFARSSGATSVHINNMYNSPPISVPVVEQFPETSAVSSSLLGVPRAETSLSLFSDVSSYGIDEENWTYQRYSSAAYPYVWYFRKNPIYGDRSNPRFYEETREQALYLKSFPVQYGFPGSPLANNSTGEDDLEENLIKYINFIAMGKWLYRLFAGAGYAEFAKRNFLNENLYPIDSSEEEVEVEFILADKTFSKILDFFDVEYGDDVEDSLFQIERWTIVYQKIRDGEFNFPGIPGTLSLDSINIIKEFLGEFAIPGDPDARENFVILESVKTFRYQPGRVSGFTFGTRQQTDPASNANYIEWGCSNDTDEYAFQLKGSTFNIVRRSTIKLPDELLLRQGLSASDQTAEPVKSVGVTDRPGLYETIIPRTRFNGDNLLGNGPSGYILSFEDVTMYKIEFSWYGAVGAKFYAYIPAGVGQARWVLMHTLIIENGLGQPILNNPDFKFKYLVYSSDHRGIDLPLYLYKYGSSYFIDGGDEGTMSLSTVTSSTKTFQDRSPIIGVMPKEELINRDGIGIVNYKKGYPSLLSVNSSKKARIDIEYVTGSPDGVHFSYAPSLHHSGTHPNTTENLIFRLNSNGTEVDILNGQRKEQDYNGKIVADGVYNTYAGRNADSSASSTYNILRRGRIGQGQGKIKKTDPVQSDEDQYDLRVASFIRGRKSDGTFVSREQTPDDVTVSAGNFVQDTVYEIVDLGIASPGGDTQIDAAQVIWNTAAGTTNTVATAFIIGTQYKITELNDTSQEQWHAAAGTTQSDDPDYAVGSIFTAKAAAAGSGKANVVYGVGDGFKATGPVAGTGKARTGEEYFSGKITNFHAVASSTVPIYANDFKIHFLDPAKAWDGPRHRAPGGRHYADYAMCIGTYAPSKDVDGNLVFYKDTENVSFNFDDVTHVVGSQLTALVDIKDRADIVEAENVFGRMFSVDQRIPAPISKEYNSDDTGQVCAIKGEVRTVDYSVSSVSPAENGQYKIVFTQDSPGRSLFPLDSDGEMVQGSAEVGVLGLGFPTPIYYVTIPKLPEPDPENAQASTKFFALVSGNPFPTAQLDADGNIILPAGAAVQTKVITLEQTWKLDERFKTALFSESRAVKFNAQPLYLSVAMQDNARVNGIVVEEITADGVIVKAPTFITAGNSATLGASGIEFGPQGEGSAPYPPSSFNSYSRSSGLRFDKQLQGTLRKGTVLHSVFVDEDKPAQFDLSNIFGIDRKTLARGMINNTATYFTATSLDGFAGNIEMTLTAKEQ